MDGDGHVCIAGLGTAFTLSTMQAVHVDQSFHAVAPELINPQRWGLADAGVTSASDVYAFGVLAWEVRVKSATSPDKRLNGRGPRRLGLRRAISILRQEHCLRGSINVERP